MKLIVGLGNPGSEYKGSRHNAGFMAVERAARRFAPGVAPRSKFNSMIIESQVGGERCIFMQPLTYMNRSGDAVGQAVAFFKLVPSTDVLVLVDEYQLPLGTIRIRTGGGTGGHNGLADVQRALGTSDYPRLRIGVDPPPATFQDPADWVLGWFTPEQLAAVSPALDRAVDAIEAFVTRGVTFAMNTYNADPSPPKPKPPRPPPSAPPDPPVM
ncbi:MAG: aminoacyl-tRNA hydrolase [Phycisphaerales bacterium]